MDGKTNSAPIIVKKKIVQHGGHHGGAWKVAYADFVTAMMALFIVLWLMNSNKEVQEAVGGYFRDPKGTSQHLGSGQGGQGEGITLTKQDMGDLKDRLAGVMSQLPQFQQVKDQVEMTVTGTGLRVELIETEQGMFFDSGSPHPSASGEELLGMLAKELGELPNTILIEGHTDSRPFTSNGGYSNWDLSTDRANAARRLMAASGLRSDQVVQVGGFADQELRNHDEPEDASNRRVSVIVQYVDQESDAPGAASVESPDSQPEPAAHSPDTAHSAH